MPCTSTPATFSTGTAAPMVPIAAIAPVAAVATPFHATTSRVSPIPVTSNTVATTTLAALAFTCPTSSHAVTSAATLVTTFCNLRNGVIRKP